VKAVALTHYLPIENPNALLDVELPVPMKYSAKDKGAPFQWFHYVSPA
jgi:hypothetical protein